ncbi:hypothetical protein [Nostoc sp. ChiQUE01b]|uniref:hypothetical protein n=1 Tax=Nostoc sp. ChiQUE01b TaxID=3075376 RepID=UPI002AD25817|nr:hypothetical protein [Nostoc sp. ChiQUE01b]MDZ8263456.1 hypothetical protein [Nostoc sp. ChiQUE01b]
MKLKLVVSVALTGLFFNLLVSQETKAKSLTIVDNSASITSLQKAETHKVLSESSLSPSHQRQTFLISEVFNLSGVWQSNDGGTYYVTQVGNQVWWYGQSADGGVGYTNVFRGILVGDRATGEWVDVPKGGNRNVGVVSIEIFSNYRFVQKGSNFGPVEWNRIS